jgi:hypothetical protein
MKYANALVIAFLVFNVPLLAGNAIFQLAHADNTKSMDSDKARIVQYWTEQRIADAIPRDLVIDPRGLGYLRKPDGTLIPYGHQVEADAAPQQVTPYAKPSGASGGTADATPPSISNLDPGSGAVIGASHTFSADVTDQESGIRSVSFVIQYPNGVTEQSFSASKEANSDTWSVTLQGFTDGDWHWWVVAKDGARKGGNTAKSDTVKFSVKTDSTGGGSGGGGGTDTISKAEWTAGGAVQTAAGRIYFEMPANPMRKSPWTGYVCSGTVIDDGGTPKRSVILTAAHCVYDDANKAFARNVLFIPNQAGTSGLGGTDLNCDNDPLGCWTPSFGVVDVNWTAATFPDNIPWDYAYYVVADSGAHIALDSSTSDVLDSDTAAGALPISFSPPFVDDGEAGKSSSDFTYALGYSYSDDPKLMYCAEDMTTEGAHNWWLPSCGLTGGSSGGPWVQPMDTSNGKGPLISVNSWGYTNSPGMAGPKLSESSGSSAQCLFTNTAISIDFGSVLTADGEAGIAANCP